MPQIMLHLKASKDILKGRRMSPSSTISSKMPLYSTSSSPLLVSHSANKSINQAQPTVLHAIQVGVIYCRISEANDYICKHISDCTFVLYFSPYFCHCLNHLFQFTQFRSQFGDNTTLKLYLRNYHIFMISNGYTLFSGK